MCQGLVWQGGDGSFALSGVSPCLQQDKLKTKQAFPKQPIPGDRLHINTDNPSPGTPLGVQGDRLHKQQTSLLVVSISKYTMRQTTQHTKPSPVTLHRVYQGVDYTPRQTTLPLNREKVICYKLFPWSPS